MADDTRNDGVPEPNIPAGDSERIRARSFGKLIDDLTDGADAPPALAAETRELLDLAATMRDALGDPGRRHGLERARRDRIIDDAFRASVGAPAASGGGGGTVTRLADRRRGRFARYAPYAVAAVAVAAAVFLFVTRPSQQAAQSQPPALAEFNYSRPADALIGKIPRDRAGDASARIDIIYADRLAGYRDLQLRGLAHKGVTP